MKRMILLATALGVLLVAQLGQAAVAMPPFSLPTAVGGQVVASETYRGQAVLITFFATWCPSCLQEIPTLKQLQAQCGKQGFAVVALSVDEGGAAAVARLVEQAGITYPVLMADRGTTRDFGNVVAVPTSFLINRSGHVVRKYPGPMPRTLLERDIAAVL